MGIPIFLKKSICRAGCILLIVPLLLCCALRSGASYHDRELDGQMSASGITVDGVQVYAYDENGAKYDLRSIWVEFDPGNWSIEYKKDLTERINAIDGVKSTGFDGWTSSFGKSIGGLIYIQPPYDKYQLIYDGLKAFPELIFINRCYLNSGNARSTYGDVDRDGSVTAADARLILRAAVRLEKISKDDDLFYCADIDSDGELTARDARFTLMMAVGLEDEELKKALFGHYSVPELLDYLAAIPYDPDKASDPLDGTDLIALSVLSDKLTDDHADLITDEISGRRGSAVYRMSLIEICTSKKIRLDKEKVTALLTDRTSDAVIRQNLVIYCGEFADEYRDVLAELTDDPDEYVAHWAGEFIGNSDS